MTLQSETNHSSSSGAASEAEIADVEEWFGMRLPSSYRSFLERFGHGGALVSADIDYKITELREIRVTAYETLREAQSPYQWRDEDFVFGCDLNGGFLMFRATGSPDPEVLYFPERGVNPTPMEITFTQWIDETYP